MKKIILGITTAILVTSLVNAQEFTPQDISRYNESDMNGTARFRGMSGAFGAVGGDLSALKINPAGSAFFNNNQASFSLSIANKNNKTSYLNNNDSKNYSGLDLSQLGASFVFNANDSNAFLKKFAIGINYESNKNLNNEYIFKGKGQTNSLGQYFLNIANNAAVPYSVVDNNLNIDQGYNNAGYENGYSGQQAYLAYQTFLIDPVTGQQGMYTSNFGSNTNTYVQGRAVVASGYNSKFSGNFGAQLGKSIFVGANLNLHIVDYTQTSNAFEANQSLLSPGTVNSISYYNNQYTYGNGFSFNLGIIGHVTDHLRAGIAYESPTWYSLKEELFQGLETTRVGEKDPSYLYPNVLNIYEKYKLRTPAKYTGSLAYIFGESGLISVDYGIKDYSNNRFRPDNGIYNASNNFYNEEMRAASELRVGAEYRINHFSVRGGYRYEQSPYKNIKYTGDLNGFSVGVGYEFAGSRLDLSYAYSTRSYKTSLVDSYYNNVYRNADLKVTDNWINLSYNIFF